MFYTREVIKSKLYIFLILISVGTMNAQSDYSVSDPFIDIVKTTDFGIVHDFIQINNHLGQDLPMRWVATLGGKGGGCPSGWSISLADPDSSYTPLNDSDSAEFVLGATNPTGNKLIIGINHNGVDGSCFISLKIYPLSNPQDVTFVGFNVTINQGAIGISAFNILDENLVYPNPSNGHFFIKNEFMKGYLYDSLGNKMFDFIEKELDLSSYPKGVYFLGLENENNIYSYIRLVKI